MAGSVNLNAGVWRRGWQALLDAVLPACCLDCGSAADAAEALCGHCRGLLPHNDSACRRCALPLPAGQHGAVCGRCQRRPPPVASTTAPFLYAAPVDRWLAALKFHRDLAAGRLLGELWAESVADRLPWPQIDAVVVMPLHRRRLRERGFNQVAELLRPLRAMRRGIVFADWLQRQRATAAQSGLSAGQRRHNLRGAFVADAAVSERRVLLVDDVITTGSTVGEAARCLLAAGAREVHVLALARVPRGLPR